MGIRRTRGAESAARGGGGGENRELELGQKLSSSLQSLTAVPRWSETNPGLASGPPRPGEFTRQHLKLLSP